MIGRRRFLNTVSGSAIGMVASMELNWDCAVALTKLNKIGLQLYTVRNEMAKDFEGSLKKVADLGYREVEFAGYYKRAPKDVRAILDSCGLAAPSAHVPRGEIRSQLEKTIEAAKIIGHRFLICPYLEEKDRKSLDDYKRHAESFNKAGETCRKAGIQFGYHNHDFEFEAKNGKLPYDLLLDETDKNLVKMELDLYWISKAGQDPIAYLNKHKDRFVLFHVKDMDKTP